MTAWRWLRSGRALRQSERRYSARRQHRLALEPLEERAMMSAEPLLPQGPYDAGAAYIAPAWFQQLSQPAAPGGDGILSTASDVGTLQWQNTALSVYQNEWIVQLSHDALAQVHSVAEVAGLFQAREFSFEVLGGLGATGQLLVRAAGASSDAVSAWLAADANIAYYEPNAILPLAQVANDPSLGLTWGLHNTGQTIGGQAGLADADIDAPEAWNLATGSSSIVVGIVDTGIDYTHPDLAANVWTNPGEIAGNGIDDDGNGFVDDVHGYNFVANTGNAMDDNGHGTHVAGTIAAVGNNGSGVAGVNWNSSVMALKFLDANGSGSVANAVRALNYATMMRNTYGVNIRVTNNSWGGGGYSQSLYDAIAANGQAGILFVAAAGNSAQNNDATPSYPSNYNLDNVIAVAATDNRDALASFSSYGATTVDLAAPGVNIYSTQAGGGYRYMSGTSMATPHVSGVAALAWSVASNASVAQIRSAILGGVDRIASLGGKVATGGRLNALGTLQLMGMNVAGSTPAAGSTATTRPTQFTVDFSQNYDAASVQAGDFTVNGVAANSYTLVDANTVRFDFSTSPVTAGGAQTMRIAEGAINQSGGGSGVRAWQGSFYYDAVPMTVVASSPAQGATLVNPPQYITLDFNEAVTAGSVGIDDLVLSSGSVTAAALMDADTVRYTVNIPRIEGAVTYTLQAGALTDAFGNPVAAYSGSFILDDPSVFRYQATDVPRQIIDGGLIYSYLTIGENRTIGDADVELSITHTWDADLRVYLVAPDGTTVSLFTHVGGSGHNFTGTVLDDAAGTAIGSGAAPFTGRYRPESPLAALNGKSTAGTWKLAVADDAAQDTGVLTGWALQFRANNTPVLVPIADQTISHRQGSLTVDLSASDADGDALTYSASVLAVDPLAQQAYNWSQQYRARYISEIDNLHRAGEKWLLAANGQLFALMANGDLRQWTGTIAGSPVVARFSAAYYADPTLLTNAPSPQSMLGPSDVTLTLQGSQLLIQPRAGATGTFLVRATASDGLQTAADTFRVSVTNVAPVLVDVPDQTMSHRQESLTVSLSASDADGDTLTYSATVLPADPLAQQAYDWSQQHRARYISSIDNLHRAGEKWLLAADGQLFALMSNGDLRQWTGTISGSPVVARFSAAYYADPTLLTNAPSPQAMLGPGTVTLTVQGNQLLIQPAAGATGSFDVRVGVSDGVQTVTDTFRVTVTNAAPVLLDVSDQTMSARQGSLTVDLSASDADGDTLTYSASVLPADPLAQQAYEWSQRLQARYINNIDNLHRAGEKWLLAANGQLYFFLSNGELRQWVGTIAASPVVARFSAAYYANPNLLCNAQSPDAILGPGNVTLTLQGNRLLVQPATGATGSFEVRVGVSDGVQTATDTFRVTVTNLAPVLTPVADQTIPAGQNSLTVQLAASDADGDTLTFAASVLPSDPLAQQAYTWSQQNRARYISHIDNLHRAQEKWLLAANGQLFALMPNGDLRQWTGTIAGSPVVARFSAAYYADPTLLTNAQSPETMLGPNDVTLTIQGSRLTIQPRAGAAGNGQIRISVTDGVQTVTSTFRLEVFSDVPPRVLQDAELDTLFQTLIVDGSIDRGDMMQLLRTAGNDNGTVDAVELSDLRYVLTNATTYHIPGYVQVLAGDVVNGNAANANFQGQALGNLAAGSSAWHINTLVDKWFLGADHPSTTYTYRSFAGSLFVGGPAYNDSDQGYLGDCYFIASMDAIAKSSPAAVQNMFIDNGDNTWTVRFYYNGTADYVTVDRYLPTSGNYAVYADVRGAYTNSGNELWMALAEKAYAQWNETGKEGRDGRNSYPSIEGGWMQTVCQQVLGSASQTYWGLADGAKQTLIAAVNANKAVTYATNGSPGNGLVGPHAYMVSSYNATTDTFQLYNPWGSSHPGPLTYAQLRSNGQCFVIADPSGSVPAGAAGARGVNEAHLEETYTPTANAPISGQRSRAPSPFALHADRLFATYDALDTHPAVA